jgi:hypothetical protein
MDCLLGDSWLEQLVEKPTFPWKLSWWAGLGLFPMEDEDGKITLLMREEITPERLPWFRQVCMTTVVMHTLQFSMETMTLA